MRLALKERGYNPPKRSFKELKKIYDELIGKDHTTTKTKKRRKTKTLIRDRPKYKQKNKNNYSKEVIKLAGRLKRIISNYGSDEVSFSATKKAILKCRFISDRNSRLKFVVNEYFTLLNNVGLVDNDMLLMGLIKNYMIKRLSFYKKNQKQAFDYNNLDQKMYKHLFNQRPTKKKKKRRKKKSRVIKSFGKKNWKQVPRRFKRKKVLYNEVDLGENLKSIERIEQRFKKLANVKEKGSDIGKKNRGISMKLVLGSVSETLPTRDEEKLSLIDSLSFLKKGLEGKCFNKTYYEKGKVDYDLFIKPEYAYVEKEIKQLFNYLNSLIDLLDAPGAFNSNPQPVLDLIEEIKKAEKPTLRRVI